MVVMEMTAKMTSRGCGELFDDDDGDVKIEIFKF